MTAPQSTKKRDYHFHKKRDYQQHGQVALSNALKTVSNRDGWVERLGEVGEALQEWRGTIIDDLGGEHAVSAMELSVIELACKTHLLLASVDRYLLEQPSLVNKSKRTIFPIVLQRQTLADALAGYMKLLGLKKQRKPPTSLGDYLKANGKATKETKQDTTAGASPGQPGTQDAQVETNPPPTKGAAP
jgi:hypothetical protein